MIRKLLRRLGYVPTAELVMAKDEAAHLRGSLEQTEDALRQAWEKVHHLTNKLRGTEARADHFLDQLADARSGHFPVPDIHRYVRVTSQELRDPGDVMTTYRVSVVPKVGSIHMVVDEGLGEIIRTDPEVYARALVKGWAQALEPAVLAEFRKITPVKA